jgi:hypothetical protein
MDDRRRVNTLLDQLKRVKEAMLAVQTKVGLTLPSARAIRRDGLLTDRTGACGQHDVKNGGYQAMENLGSVLIDVVGRRGPNTDSVCREACAMVTHLARHLAQRGVTWAVAIMPPLLDRLEEEVGALR